MGPFLNPGSSDQQKPVTDSSPDPVQAHVPILHAPEALSTMRCLCASAEDPRLAGN